MATWVDDNDGLAGQAWLVNVGGTLVQVNYPGLGLFTPSDYTVDGVQADRAIDGTRSLVMAGPGPGNGVDICTGSSLQPYTALSGVIRASVKLHGVFSGVGHAGVVVLASQSTLRRGGGGKGYALLLDTILFGNRVKLVQLTNGISGSPGGAIATTYTLLHETSNGAVAAGLVMRLVLYWAVDLGRLHGVRLLAKYGTSDASLVAFPELVVTGPTAYLPTSVYGAGVMKMAASTSGVVHFDAITLSTINSH